MVIVLKDKSKVNVFKLAVKVVCESCLNPRNKFFYYFHKGEWKRGSCVMCTEKELKNNKKG